MPNCCQQSEKISARDASHATLDCCHDIAISRSRVERIRTLLLYVLAGMSIGISGLPVAMIALALLALLWLMYRECSHGRVGVLCYCKTRSHWYWRQSQHNDVLDFHATRYQSKRLLILAFSRRDGRILHLRIHADAVNDDDFSYLVLQQRRLQRHQRRTLNRIATRKQS